MFPLIFRVNRCTIPFRWSALCLYVSQPSSIVLPRKAGVFSRCPFKAPPACNKLLCPLRVLRYTRPHSLGYVLSVVPFSFLIGQPCLAPCSSYTVFYETLVVYGTSFFFDPLIQLCFPFRFSGADPNVPHAPLRLSAVSRRQVGPFRRSCSVGSSLNNVTRCTVPFSSAADHGYALLSRWVVP